MRGAFPCRILDVATRVLDISNKVKINLLEVSGPVQACNGIALPFNKVKTVARAAGGFFELLLEVRQ
jgi:hypothetical protein